MAEYSDLNFDLGNNAFPNTDQFDEYFDVPSQDDDVEEDASQEVEAMEITTENLFPYPIEENQHGIENLQGNNAALFNPAQEEVVPQNQVPDQVALVIEVAAAPQNTAPMQTQVVADHLALVQGVFLAQDLDPPQHAGPLQQVPHVAPVAANALHPPADVTQLTVWALNLVSWYHRYRTRSGVIIIPRKFAEAIGEEIRQMIPPSPAGGPLDPDRTDWDRVVNLLRKQGWLIVVGRSYAIMIPPEALDYM